MTFRVAAGALVAAAAAGAVAVACGSGAGPFRLAGWLGEHGGAAYAVWIYWTLVAPAVLLAGAVIARRSPWPWVVACAVHLLSVTVAVARLAHLSPWWVFAAAAAIGAAGIGSIVTAFGPGDRPGSARPRRTACERTGPPGCTCRRHPSRRSANTYE